MRTPLLFLTLTLALLGSVSSATFELTADAMRDMEDITRSLDSDVALKDGKAAAAETRELLAFFQQVETFYAQKGDAEKAVGFARKTQEVVAQAQAAIEAQKFDEAGEAVSALAKSCKTCHDVYKTPK